MERSRLTRSPMNWQPKGRNRRRQRKRFSDNLRQNMGNYRLSKAEAAAEAEGRSEGEKYAYGFWLRNISCVGKILKKRRENKKYNDTGRHVSIT